MCSSGDHDHHAGDVVQSMPRPVEGEAVDAIGLEPVDEVMITTLVDNSYDALLADAGPVRRARRGRFPSVPAPQFEQGETTPGLVAEHGFAALVTTRRGDRTHTVLFDTGVSPNGLADNLERLDLEASDIEAVVLSHGHFDHAGGFPGLAKLRAQAGPADHGPPARVDVAPRRAPGSAGVGAAGAESVLTRG